MIEEEIEYLSKSNLPNVLNDLSLDKLNINNTLLNIDNIESYTEEDILKFTKYLLNNMSKKGNKNINQDIFNFFNKTKKGVKTKYLRKKKK
jgi:hypothetical protein